MRGPPVLLDAPSHGMENVGARVYPALVSVLEPRTQLGVQLSAICGRHRYTAEPASVITELRAVAGQETDLLAEECGTWCGFYRDEHPQILADSIIEQIHGAADWTSVGERRRGLAHGTAGYATQRVSMLVPIRSANELAL